MRTHLLLALVFACACARAQAPFEKIYDTGVAHKYNIMELGSQNLLVAMGCGRGISRLDPNGNVIQFKCFWGDTVIHISSIRKYSDNEFYFVAGYYKDTCTAGALGLITKIHPAIGRMDSVGNITSFRYYVFNGPSCINSASDLEITSAAGVITWGRDSRFFALRTDPAGAPVWAKYFSHNGGFRFIKELPGGDLLAGINMDTAGAVVARLDPDGNFIWCKSYLRPKGMIHDCLVESDSSFIVTGYTDSIASTNIFTPLPPVYHPKLFMMKLNGNGDVQWCKGYDSDPNLWYARRGSRIERTQDSNYVVLANLGVVGYNTHYRPFLMQTDQNGDTLWTRSAGSDDYAYTTSDLLAYSDGGFLYNGIVYGDLPGNSTGEPYIYKTDSLGHLPCSEQWHPIVMSDLFPTDSSFTLTSIDGAVALPAFVSDTIFDPITVYDGCTITSVIDPRHPRKFKVYPNPTTGQFTVEFEDPLMAESYYSVYDAMGRLLYQRPLPSGATMEQVDLSRYGKGAYVIKLTDREGVRYERVVLE